MSESLISMHNLLLRVKRISPDAKLPAYALSLDAGLDLFALCGGVVRGNARAQVRTGVAVEIPTGWVGLMWDKSGLARDRGITVLGGCIDSTYRGELTVILYNTDTAAYRFEPGDKIAQLLLVPVYQACVMEVAELSVTARGAGGFGHTGK